MSRQLAACPGLLVAVGEHLDTPRIVILCGPMPEPADWQRRLRPICPNDALCLVPPDAGVLPDVLAKPVRTYVGAHVCTGDNCLPEIVRFEDLRAIYSN